MNKISIIAAMLCVTFAFSQNNKYNKFSIETAYGLNHPLSPKVNSGAGAGVLDDLDAGDFSEFKHFDIGGRYMVNQLYGFKFSYAYDRFQYDATSLAINYNRVGVEAVINFDKLFNISFNRQRSFQIQAHTGVGITFAKPKRKGNTEKIGNLMIGITPLFKVTDRIAITTDLSYIVNFKQHYDYGGTNIDPNKKDSVTGGFVNFTIGLNFSIGDSRSHADWY